MMKNLGIVSYNINFNSTNYGSVLQSWALSQVRCGTRIPNRADVRADGATKMVKYVVGKI